MGERGLTTFAQLDVWLQSATRHESTGHMNRLPWAKRGSPPAKRQPSINERIIERVFKPFYSGFETCFATNSLKLSIVFLVGWLLGPADEVLAAKHVSNQDVWPILNAGAMLEI